MPPPAHFVARWGRAARALTTTVHSVTRWVTGWAFTEVARWAGLCKKRPVDAEEGWIVIEASVPDQRSDNPIRAAVAWQCMGIAGFLWSCLYISSVLFAVELISVHLEQSERGLVPVLSYGAQPRLRGALVMPTAGRRDWCRPQKRWGKRWSCCENRRRPVSGRWVLLPRGFAR